MKLRGYFARLKNESCEERDHIHTYVHTLTHKDFAQSALTLTVQLCSTPYKTAHFPLWKLANERNEGSPQCKFCHILFFSSLSFISLRKYLREK